MKYFKPEFPKGQEETLPFQIRSYKWNFLWPLEQQATIATTLILHGGALLSFLAYLATVIAEFTFIYENFSDVPAISDCLSTTCMGVQYGLRIILRIRGQASMRDIFNRFYKEIYFTNADDAQLRHGIQKNLRMPGFFTKVYYSAAAMLYIKFVWDIYQSYSTQTDNPYIYRMSFRWYDAQKPLAYMITSFYSGWLTFSCVALMSAEDFTICLMLCHTSFRFKELHKRLDHIFEEARADPRRTAGDENVHSIFRRKLNATFRKQQKLNSFIADAKAHFTYQIFCCLGFGVALLCVVSFQFQRTSSGLGLAKYVLWLVSQSSEFIMIGYFGQMLTDATFETSQRYYMCHWEKLLPYGDVHSNKLLMIDIRFAMMNAQRPQVMEGLKFFSLTHRTVGNGIRSAVSYFMFLNTMSNEDGPM